MLKALALRLKDPPIVEVVCGFFFAPLPGLDPLVVGKYWSEEKERHGFPNRQLQPPVADVPGVLLGGGVGPLRSWLISEHDEYVLQIQPDRFYFNWRKRGGDYPHFNDYGDTTGVLSRSLKEFEAFARFASATLGQSPRPTRLELAKIDWLVNPKHYRSYSDLRAILPVLGRLPPLADDPTVHVSFAGEREGFLLQFGLTNAVLGADMSSAVQMETRVTARDVGANPRETFVAMNRVVNSIFFETIPESEFYRFGGTVA